jgi:ZIP family zinc transporter
VTPVSQVFWAAVLSDVATGVGVLPLVGWKSQAPKWQGITAAVAGGMMLSASVLALGEKALQRGSAGVVLLGAGIGAVFVGGFARVIAGRAWRIPGVSESASRRSLLLVTTLFVHSIPEGLAIGVGYATGELGFGLLLAIVIAIHNIPEGTAVAVPLRANGASMVKCAAYAVLTSLPQPVVAVPAFLLVSVFQPLLPGSLGFAAGAMVYLVISEMIPESLAVCSAWETGWGMAAGVAGMAGVISALQ